MKEEIKAKIYTMKKESTTPQQILQNAREEFEKRFVKTDKIPLFKFGENIPEEILSWHTSTLQAFLEAEIERLEKQKGMIKNPEFYTKLKRIMKGNIVMKGMDDITFTQIAWEAKDTLLDDQISHLKELLKR